MRIILAKLRKQIPHKPEDIPHKPETLLLNYIPDITKDLQIIITATRLDFAGKWKQKVKEAHDSRLAFENKRYPHFGKINSLFKKAQWCIQIELIMVGNGIEDGTAIELGHSAMVF